MPMEKGVEPTDRPAVLAYQDRPRLALIGRHRKKLIFLAIIIAIAIPAYRYWTPLKHRVLWIYWFRQALAYRMPEKPVDVQLHDPTNAASALSTNPDYVASTRVPGGAIFRPIPYGKLLQEDSRLNLVNQSGSGVAFMGLLVRPDGTPRLVIITDGRGHQGNVLSTTDVIVLPLLKWTDPSPPPMSTPSYGHICAGPIPQIVRLRSGRPDPADHSHIVFEYVYGPSIAMRRGSPSPDTVQSTGTIDAFLQDDDSIKFQMGGLSGNYARITTPVLRNSANVSLNPAAPTSAPTTNIEWRY